MARKMIFHMPVPISDRDNSGSQLRPKKLIEAFNYIGYEVDIIAGYAKNRKKKIELIKDKIKNGEKYDFVYSESATMPTLLTESHHLPLYPFLDFSFFNFLKKNNISIGLFYRDIHWNFDELYNIKFYKKTIARLFYYWDLYNYNKFINVLYLPSVKMDKYIPYNINTAKKPLPPGIAEIVDTDFKNHDKIVIFYVGGIGNLYNLKKIVKVVSNLEFVELIICTRESDWINSKSEYKIFDNITIIHKSGEDLLPYYKQADLLNLFIKPINYWDFAMPYKLFEYLSMQKPIIAVKNTASGKFVKDNQIGWAINYKKENLRKLLKKIYLNKSLLKNKKNNMLKIANDNLWESRALSVVNDLNLKYK